MEVVFLFVSEAGINLLEQDLMIKLEIGLKVNQKGLQVTVNFLSEKEEKKLSHVWAKEGNCGD
jgi:hypothetical protein